MLLASEVARPREAILALGEVLEGLEDQMETFDVSDDGEEFEDDDDFEGDPLPGLIRELSLLLEAYTLGERRSTSMLIFSRSPFAKETVNAHDTAAEQLTRTSSLRYGIPNNRGFIERATWKAGEPFSSVLVLVTELRGCRWRAAGQLVGDTR